MARTIRNQKLDTRSARLKLPTQKAPHWAAVAPGCAIGYRKGAKGGVWLAKFVGENARKEITIGPADDVLDADGVSALSFSQAQEKARDWFSRQAKAAAGHVEPAGPYTVSDALADYLAWFQTTGRKSVKETTYAANAFILPKLGSAEVVKLTATQLRAWHKEVADAPPRLRTKKTEAVQKVRDTADDPEAPRRRQATANRVLTILKATLNHAWKEHKVPSDDAWRRVQPFREADSARVRYLSRDECARLVNACSPDFRRLVQAALLTGARYGELTAFRVADFHPDTGTVLVRASKSGKSRHIELTDEGVRLFGDVTVGRPAEALIFNRDDGSAWGKAYQHRPIKEACTIGKIKPSASFHVLRHTYASLMVMDAVPLMVVARNLGHSDTRMVEKHYGHLSRSYIRDAIRGSTPLGIVPESNVQSLPVAGRK